jgi:hypothetical protein
MYYLIISPIWHCVFWYPWIAHHSYILMLLFPEDEEFLYIIVRKRQFILIDGVTGCVPEEEEIVLLSLHHPCRERAVFFGRSHYLDCHKASISLVIPGIIITPCIAANPLVFSEFQGYCGERAGTGQFITGIIRDQLPCPAGKFRGWCGWRQATRYAGQNQRKKDETEWKSPHAILRRIERHCRL